MIANLTTRTLAALLTSSLSLVLALSSHDIPSDAPISSLIDSANKHLANGQTNDALLYYDVAIARDPRNYLTYFKRGAAYLSLGKISKACADFDEVLSIKPGFEGALVQRAKIKARIGEWEASKKDYLAHGNSVQDLALVEEARKASIFANNAENLGKWEECIVQSSKATEVASRMLTLRLTRANCRIQNGETREGIMDLKHVLQIQPGMTESRLQISATLFYDLADMEQGIDQIRNCLHYDQDLKSCKKLYHRERALEKQINLVKKNLERKQYVTSLKTLIPSSSGVGLIQEIKDDIKELREAGTIAGKSTNKLLGLLLGLTCEAYFKASTQKNFHKARAWCDEALEYEQNNLYGLLSRAQKQIEAEHYEAAINSLTEASNQYPDSHEIKQMLQDAQVNLKRSKTKDYYSVLGLPRDADSLQIKSAYRRLIKKYHPDKAHKQGVSKEEAEKKMATINEAYEVLSDPELKKRYDHGDDPNDHEQRYQNPFEQNGWYAPGSFQSSDFGGNSFRYEFNGEQFLFN
ncbi:DnaJ-like protein subfamily C member 3 [Golovinomyces cichoracearum]|uniref:Tetratricopeptide repeat and J domain-containing co-chaperone DNJ1 n=1 Tax=Golovinomyces cichoracearum TaxID=62708 RepID=A0A420IFU6_9PEZI|nr:DnaJ-like protein subfamily C member 3 [Golovinomyces cichoracearum]